MDASMLPLQSVIANDELSRRRPRHRMQDALELALGKLAGELATSPRQVLQKLTDAALELCQSHSAGVSLLEAEGDRQFFRWHAVSGRWAPLVWTTLPREFSPCGTVLDRKAAQLMILPERHFTPLAQVPPKVYEALLVPFEVAGELVGTVWVISHDPQRRFDSEDRRVVARMATFAAEAYECLSSLSANDVDHLSRLNVGSYPTKPSRATVQKRILVVDDNTDAANSLAMVLRTMGHEVQLAYDGRGALEAVHRVQPNIVLLDITMPDMSGYQVAQQIREKFGSSVRIMAVTGRGRAEDSEEGQGNFDQHLNKPVDMNLLKSLLG
jgi:CheY-like chemotaxis protein